jgi:hypothetical protein
MDGLISSRGVFGWSWIFSVFDRYIYEIYNGTSLKGYAEDVNYMKKLKK